MPDAVSPDITVIEGNQRRAGNKDVLIKGESPIMKTWFFEAVKRCTSFYEDEAKYRNAGGIRGQTACYRLDGRENGVNGEVKVKGLQVFFDSQSLDRNGDGNLELKEAILLHEAMEIWYEVKPGTNVYDKFSKGDRRAVLLAHFLGMIEEYKWLKMNGQTNKFRKWYQQSNLNEIGRGLDNKAYEIVQAGNTQDDLSQDLDRLYDDFWSVYSMK